MGRGVAHAQRRHATAEVPPRGQRNSVVDAVSPVVGVGDLVSNPPTVVALNRYPVKSMLGEEVSHLDIEKRGCVADRFWAARTANDKIGSGKNTRRFAAVPGLLAVRAQHRDGRVVLSFPDGSSCLIDDPEAALRLSRHLGQDVTLAEEGSVNHFDDGPVSIIGSGSIAAVTRAVGAEVDPVRFRANIIVEPVAAFGEEDWIGRRIRVGEVVLQVTMASTRCVMVDASTADLPAQPGNLAAIGRLNDARLGVLASVAAPGRVNVGDTLELQ